MARPKRSPRDHLHVKIPKPLVRELRGFARKRDLELSAVVASALRLHMDCEYIRDSEAPQL